MKKYIDIYELNFIGWSVFVPNLTICFRLLRIVWSFWPDPSIHPGGNGPGDMGMKLRDGKLVKGDGKPPEKYDLSWLELIYVCVSFCTYIYIYIFTSHNLICIAVIYFICLVVIYCMYLYCLHEWFAVVHWLFNICVYIQIHVFTRVRLRDCKRLLFV